MALLPVDGTQQPESIAIGATIPTYFKTADDRAMVYAEPRPRGTRVARIMVVDGDVNADGCRTEIQRAFGTTTQAEALGTEGWYTLAVQLPDGSDAYGRGDPLWESSSSWAILWQLHHPQSGTSPPFALRADRDGSGALRLWMDIRGGDLNTVALGSGNQRQTKAQILNPLPLGKWIRLIFYVAWRADATGVFKCWANVDGVDTDFVQRCNYDPANGNGIRTFYTDSGTGAYWQWGIYASRHNHVVPKRVVYHTGFRRLQSYADCIAWQGVGTSGGGGTTPPSPSIPLPPDQDRFGTATGGDSMAVAGPDVSRGSVYQLDQAASVAAVKAYLDGLGAASGSATCRAVIYDAATKARVAVSNEVTVAAGQAGAWVEFPLSAPVNLQAGSYGLHLHTGGAAVIRYAVGTAAGDQLQWGPDAYTDGPLATWTGSVDTPKRAAIYAMTSAPAGSSVRAVAAAETGGFARLRSASVVVVPLSDITWSIHPALLTADVIERAEYLRGRGLRVIWPQVAVRKSTGERLVQLPDGTYVPATTS